MARPKDDLEEATRLQQEAEKLRIRPQEPATDTQATQMGEDASGSDLPIEKVLEQLEKTVRERPALALLTAFSVGVLVGRMSARR